MLELESTDKGLLLPRLTKTQMHQMTNVPKGMLVYNITDSTVSVRRDTGWIQLADKVNPNAAFEVSGNNIYNTNSGNVGIGTTVAIEKLEVAGRVSSMSGGFKFPDGTIQTTAITKFVSAFTATNSNEYVIYHGLNSTDVSIVVYSIPTQYGSGRVVPVGSQTLPYLNIIDNNTISFPINLPPLTTINYRLVIFK